MKRPTSKVKLKVFLDSIVDRVNRPDFILDDPICIPKRFRKKEDIEITAFWTSILAWGQRKTIINKATELFELMDNAPHQFLLEHQDVDLKRFAGFKHRTFQYTDTLYFIHFLRKHYTEHASLETAFTKHMSSHDKTVEAALNGFYDYFFDSEYAPKRTRKHLSCPRKKSKCKRINMFLRWMVRSDSVGVDFGLWKNIKPSQLFLPLDVHVENSARDLGLITSKTTNWKTVVELTDKMSELDPTDPVKYDFALFGLGVLEL